MEREHCRPSAATLAWAAAQVGPGAKVFRWSKLTGGIASSVHQLAVVGADGITRQLVLKRWLNEDRSAALAEFDRESTVLGALEATDLPVPLLIASSAQSAEGHPVVLMSRVRGRVNLAPRTPREWLGQMAASLVQIHASRVQISATPPWPVDPFDVAPEWSVRPHLWEAAGRILDGPAPEDSCFIHGDYQHFNLLWANGRLTGIVDWAWGGLGHPDRDVGHCRLNLAVLYSVDFADQFTLAYEAEAGRKLEPWWDLHEIFLYDTDWPRTIPLQVHGRVPLDIQGMNQRVEQLLAHSLGRR